MMKSYSVFYIEQKMEFEKFSCFFADFLRYRFGRIRVLSIGAEREYTPNITRQICFEYQLTDFYMIRGFTERYFLTDYSYILENHFYFINAPDYCFKSSLSSSSSLNCLLNTKVLRPIYFAHHRFARSLFTERKK